MKETRKQREARRWAAARSYLGSFITHMESAAVGQEEFQDAADWRDLKAELDQAEKPVSKIQKKINKD